MAPQRASLAQTAARTSGREAKITAKCHSKNLKPMREGFVVAGEMRTATSAHIIDVDVIYTLTAVSANIFVNLSSVCGVRASASDGLLPHNFVTLSLLLHLRQINHSGVVLPVTRNSSGKNRH